MDEERPLILASASRGRRDLLAAAGLTFDIVPADIDEVTIRQTLLADDDGIDPVDIAEVLARAKAEAVSRDHPDRLVIGSDQVLARDARLYGKPADLEEARVMLMSLRGVTHELHTAVALAKGGDTVWAHVETAYLTMRNFSAAFLDGYLAHVGARICDVAGAYEIEGPGVQLFARIEGDYFTIVGLPLLPLLQELRARDRLPS
jgi:nucleoside triphosphate pyrophosphatase